MTREQFLRYRLGKARHKLIRYSTNMSKSKPKLGCEAAFERTTAEIDMLMDWLEDFRTSKAEDSSELNRDAKYGAYTKAPPEKMRDEMKPSASGGQWIGIELKEAGRRPSIYSIKVRIVGDYHNEEIHSEVYEAFIPKLNQLMAELDPNP